MRWNERAKHASDRVFFFRPLVVIAILFLLSWVVVACTSGKWIRPSGELVTYDQLTQDEKARVKVEFFQEQLISLWNNTKALVDGSPNNANLQEAWRTQLVPAFDAANKTLADVIQRASDGDLGWDDARQMVLPTMNRLLLLLSQAGLIEIVE